MTTTHNIDGLGFADYMAYSNPDKDLNQEILDKLSQIETLVNKLKDSENLHELSLAKDQRLVDLYDNMQAFVKYLKTDIPYHLKIAITFTSDDGD
ncbi:MAG: hypothetical protein HRT66_08845 [Flavobacteriaceae bacterium]|nr:hypothetical protein [Flavobacteriaceae bacterium]